MEKIINTDLSKCTTILYDDSPSYSGIVAGECTGDVWVDHIENPTLALVYSFAVGGFSIMGEPDDVSVYDDFVRFLRETLFVELKSKGMNYFEFSVESKRTEEKLLRLFANENINQEDEYFYRSSRPYDHHKMTPYNIIQIDSDFITALQTGKYENAKFLSERLLESWATYEQFLMKSIGYVATHENYIAALIVGTARYKKVVPIDIETDESHRQKGLALVLTQHFVNMCVEKGLVAQWDCVESNIASRRTVEKAGFKFIKKKPVYWFEI
ncbi:MULTISPECIES: GNAT family N-acetyltransferase [unclassified Fusibacter]|uniref:GNAT family N-acetyltransferase n=1 Tax=unclassified Fusibacter TaxID=2624464 RepID=UPI0013E8F5C1|nr:MULTISPECIES: GNAT family N-acetyltransferase [unclassified Fusibacter]MCK8061118.1 GNAT family N-acetyltransferase [Fusibacter sp. A2]NPE23346.1 GNAT family N-acetyltransferase [Fusibacter sp. A1]